MRKSDADKFENSVYMTSMKPNGNMKKDVNH